MILAATSLVHGLAHLLINGATEAKPDDVEHAVRLARDVTAVFGAGVLPATLPRRGSARRVPHVIVAVAMRPELVPPILAGLSFCGLGVMATRPIRKAHPVRLALEIVTAAGFGGFPAAVLFVASVDGGRFTSIYLMVGFPVGILMSSAMTRWAARFLRPSGPNADAFGPFARGVHRDSARVRAGLLDVRDHRRQPYIVAAGAALVGTVTTVGLQLRGG